MRHRTALTILLLAISFQFAPITAAKATMQAPFSRSPVIVDGRWTSENEWTDAAEAVLVVGERTCDFRIKHDGSSIFLLWDFTADTKIEMGSGSDGDRVTIEFDVNHDGIVKPDVGPDFFVFLYWWTDQRLEILEGAGPYGHYTIGPGGLSAASSLTATPLHSTPHVVYEMSVDEVKWGIQGDTVGIRTAAYDAGHPSATSLQFPADSDVDKGNTWADLSFGPVTYNFEVKIDPPEIASNLNLPDNGQYPSGTTQSLGQIPDVIEAGQGVRYVKKTVLLDGRDATPPLTITMNQDHLLEIHYQKQYYLNVSTTLGTSQGSGWYDENSNATFFVKPPDQGGLVQYRFAGWKGDYTGTDLVAQITLSRPMSIVAAWEVDYSLLIILLVSSIVVVGLLVGFLFRRRMKKSA
jgi:hypothetical protein